jgi:hypothetical protein
MSRYRPRKARILESIRKMPPGVYTRPGVIAQDLMGIDSGPTTRKSEIKKEIPIYPRDLRGILILDESSNGKIAGEEVKAFFFGSAGQTGTKPVWSWWYEDLGGFFLGCRICNKELDDRLSKHLTWKAHFTWKIHDDPQLMSPEGIKEKADLELDILAFWEHMDVWIKTLSFSEVPKMDMKKMTYFVVERTGKETGSSNATPGNLPRLFFMDSKGHPEYRRKK